MGISVDYDVTDPPFNKIPNIDKIEFSNGYLNKISFSMSGASFGAINPSSKEYIIYLKDGSSYEFTDSELKDLMEQLYKDVSFEDAVMVMRL